MPATAHTPETAEARHSVSGEAQTAEFELNGGPVQLRLKIRVTPAGLWAITGLVSGILLSTTALVWVSTTVLRRHPLASAVFKRA